MIFLLYEVKISLQFMETLRPIIDIVDKIKSENVTIRQTRLDEIKFVCFLKRIWWSLSIMQKYDLSGKNNPSFLLHMDEIFICTFYLLL